MISGTGIDIIEVNRIELKMNKDKEFKELVFSNKEIAYCEIKANKHEHYAACFAAKEVFLKVIRTGWADGTSYNEIEITNNDLGKPRLNLLGATKKTLAPLKITNISVSLSHIKPFATAIAIVEK